MLALAKSTNSTTNLAKKIKKGKSKLTAVSIKGKIINLNRLYYIRKINRRKAKNKRKISNM